MTEFENKFFVVNLKHLDKIPPYYRNFINLAFDKIKQHVPDNSYFVCNQDEPYAKDVIRIIMDGEDAKKNV